MMQDAAGDHRPPETIRLPARGWRIEPRHALIAAALCWAGFALMAILVLSGHAAGFDAAGLRFWRSGAEAQSPPPRWLVEGMRDLTALGGVLLRHVFALTAMVALLFLKLRREAVLLICTVVSGWGVGALLKALVGRPRPDIVPHLMDAGGNSFPSGHSFNAAVVYIAVGLAFAAMSARRAIRWMIIGSAAVLTLLIGLSRVWLGVHFPSDVIAGWLGGAGWAFLASALLYRPAREMAR